MAVKLRLKRMGKKKQPVYKVVAADARSPRDGKFIEAIGLYNPKTEPATVEIKEDRALYWLNVGAQPTETVRSLLSQKGILLKRDLMKRGFSEEEIAKRLEEWTKLKEAKLAAALKKAEKSKSKKQLETKADTIEDSNSAAEVKGTASGEA
ncbi:MAG: 30S ribosomal protein S16 [Melioribacter sp.]|uniref:30S ribosomal protein S16 n=1 Tax=Rosettibacter primus TaxID=3111523 RepID=UPI00247E763E|nr:30S ribosomal protein S16 [Melioribacter sp.]